MKLHLLLLLVTNAGSKALAQEPIFIRLMNNTSESVFINPNHTFYGDFQQAFKALTIDMNESLTKSFQAKIQSALNNPATTEQTQNWMMKVEQALRSPDYQKLWQSSLSSADTTKIFTADTLQLQAIRRNLISDFSPELAQKTTIQILKQARTKQDLLLNLSAIAEVTKKRGVTTEVYEAEARTHLVAEQRAARTSLRALKNIRGIVPSMAVAIGLEAMSNPVEYDFTPSADSVSSKGKQ